MIYVIDITSIHRYQGITIDNLIWVSKKKEFSKEGHVTVNFYAFVWFQPYVRGSSDQDVIIDIREDFIVGNVRDKINALVSRLKSEERGPGNTHNGPKRFLLYQYKDRESNSCISQESINASFSSKLDYWFSRDFRLEDRESFNAFYNSQERINASFISKLIIWFSLAFQGEDRESINASCISQVDNRSYRGFAPLCNLEDLVQICVNGNKNGRLEQLKQILGEIKLTENGRPTSLLQDLIKDMVFQLVELHKSEKFHGGLKPRNVLIIKGIRGLCAKLSDDHYSNGCETDDLFELGRLFLFCFTGYDPDYLDGNIDLFPVEDLAEAHHLISLLLSPDPKLRPKAIEVREHPLLWDSDKRLSFLRDTSDVVEKYPHLLKELDETKQDIARIKYRNRRLVSTWMKTMPGGLIDHMLEYRKYDPVKVSELLRFIRNAYGHYKEFPGDIKAVLIGVEERKDLDAFFTSRFPKLLIEIYKGVRTHCEKEDFKEYFVGQCL